MLILNCTKAAAEFFSRTKKGKKFSALEPAPKQTIAESIAESAARSMAESNSPQQWQWLVHAVKVKGKTILIAMDYQSRFSICLSALKKGDDAAFLNMFEHHLIVHIYEMMSSIDAEHVIDTSFDRFRLQHFSRAFYLRGDRSVQAHINDVVWHFRRWVDDAYYEKGLFPEGAGLIGHDVFVNHLLRKRKGEKDYFYPQREFLHGWLRHCGAYNTSQADACIKILAAKDCADFAAKYPDLKTTSDTNAVSQAAYSSLPSRINTPSATNFGTEFGGNVISLDAYRKR